MYWNREVRNPRHSLLLGDQIEIWAGHVLRLRAEAAGPRPEDWWGAHDFLAALYIRDVVQQGLDGSAPTTVDAIDELFRDFCEPDSRDAIHALDPGAPHQNWWWSLIPRLGPAREEFDAATAARDKRT